MPCAILVRPVKPARFVVNFVLIVVLGSTALAVSAALLVPAGQTFKAAVSPLGPLNVRIQAQPQRPDESATRKAKAGK